MQLNQTDKQKFLEYLEKKRLQNHEKMMLKTEEENPNFLLSEMLQDLLARTNRISSKEVFEDYIFTHAITSVEDNLSKTDKETLEQEVNDQNWYLIFGELLTEQKYLVAFMGGLIFGYTKLCYKLKIEPLDKFVSIVNILPLS